MEQDSNFVGEFCLWLRSALNIEAVINSEQKKGYHFLSIIITEEHQLYIVLRSVDSVINTDHEIGLLLDSYRIIGKRIVIVWEDLWFTKNVIIQSRILALLGISERIPGRLTKVRRIDKKTASDFLIHHHLQGSTSSKYQFGLYLPKRHFRILSSLEQVKINDIEEILMAVATFSQVRIFKKGDESYRSYELIRFSNRQFRTVVGGFDKLLAAFTKVVKPDDIMTYADLDWSDGASYRKLGFVEISRISPMNWIVDLKTKERVLSKSVDNTIDTGIIVKNSGSIKFVRKTGGS